MYWYVGCENDCYANHPSIDYPNTRKAINETDKTMHWICVPSIFFCLVGFLYCIKLPFFIGAFQLNVALLAMVAVIAHYFNSSTRFGRHADFGIFCLEVCELIEASKIIRLWLFSLILFVVPWTGQFYGDNVEGKKPSF